MEQVAGVILAGGLSRRMGGGDKGLRALAGKQLLQHVVDRLAPQASPIALNANGDAGRFSEFRLPVIADATSNFAGPLAGVLAGLRWAAAEAPAARFIATAACDTPFFPENLVLACLAVTDGAYPAIVLARSGGQVHPVFGIWPVALADDLDQALANGTRKVLDWTSRHSAYVADFPEVRFGDRFIDPFFNANTREELAEAESFLVTAQTK